MPIMQHSIKIEASRPSPYCIRVGENCLKSE